MKDVPFVDVLISPIPADRDVNEVSSIVLEGVEHPDNQFDRMAEGGGLQCSGAHREPHTDQIPERCIDSRHCGAEAHVCRPAVMQRIVRRDLALGSLENAQMLQRGNQAMRNMVVLNEQASYPRHHGVARKDGTVVGMRRRRRVNALRAAKGTQKADCVIVRRG